MIVGKQVSLPRVHSWQVYLAKEPKFFGVKEGDQINLDDYELVAKIDGEYPPFQVAQNIEDAWVSNDTTLEVYGDNQNGCRSLSVSDVVCNTISGQCYIVNNIGYHLLSEEFKSAEGDPEWMTNKDLRRRLFLKSQKTGVPKICEVCEDSESNLLYYQEDGEQFVVCKNCLEQSMDDWKTIFGRRPNWNAEFNSSADAYAMAYSQGHSHGRNQQPYDPKLTKQERNVFIRTWKNAESKDFEAQVDNNDRFLVDITCSWCGEPYDGTEVLDEYEGTIVHYRCAASDGYEAEFEAPSYGNYYGACLLPDGSCTETSLDMCRALGGRFQGPGTSCHADAGWARPRVMRAESSNGLGKGFTIGIVAGIISGLVTTVFGTVISEIFLDRLREDPELEITDEDSDNTP